MTQHVGAGGMPLREAQSKGGDFARTPQFEWLARAGLVARGVIYAIVGVLAIELALGGGGKTTDQQGALAEIARQPFGKLLLVAMAIGLAGYAIWRLVRAAIGHGPGSTDDTKTRIGGFVSGIAYLVLCGTAVAVRAPGRPRRRPRTGPSAAAFRRRECHVAVRPTHYAIEHVFDSSSGPAG